LIANYELEVSGAGGAKTYGIILYQKLIIQNKIEIDSTHLVLADFNKQRLFRRHYSL
jgi:hypothetical protein